MSKETTELWRLPEPSFDVQTLTVDYQATDEYYANRVGQERGSNLLLLAHDQRGTNVMLKGAIFFRAAKKYRVIDQAAFIAEQQAEGIPAEQIIREQAENTRLAALAYQFGQALGFDMIETYQAVVEGFPFTAMKYIPGLVDRAYGSMEINYPEPPVQAAQLASGALLKFILDACYDDGQYQQAPTGTIYLGDIRLLPVSVRTPTLVDAIARFLTQGGRQMLTDGTQLSLSDGFFSAEAVVVIKQLIGTKSLQFSTQLHKLEALNYPDLLNILALNPEAPTEQELLSVRCILERAHLARPAFELLSRHLDLTLKAMKTVQGGDRICTSAESWHAQQELLSLASGH